jgi:hypothetical protein
MWVDGFVEELRKTLREHNLRWPDKPLNAFHSKNFYIVRDSVNQTAVRIVWGDSDGHRVSINSIVPAQEAEWREVDQWRPTGDSHVFSEASQRALDARGAAEALVTLLAGNGLTKHSPP